MKNFARLTGIAALMLMIAFAAVPQAALAEPTVDDACWGQATAVFAKTGEMGYHSANQDNPRMGLGNLARVLYDAGVIEDDTLAALGAWIASELNLDIAACQ